MAYSVIKVVNSPVKGNKSVPDGLEKVYYFGKRAKYIGPSVEPTSIKEHGYTSKYRAKYAAKVLLERLPLLSDKWERKVTIEEYNILSSKNH